MRRRCVRATWRGTSGRRRSTRRSPGVLLRARGAPSRSTQQEAIAAWLSPVRKLAESVGNYTAIYSPMFWEGRGIGSIAVFRQPPRPFGDKEEALLRRRSPTRR